MNPIDSRNTLVKQFVSNRNLEQFLLEHGYFPENWVVPPFLTIFLDKSGVADDKRRKPISLFTPKNDTAWRDFKFIHPSNHQKLVEYICKKEILNTVAHIFTCSDRIISYSTPQLFVNQKERAGQQIEQWLDLQDELLLSASRDGYKYVITADIANCYHTLYTHTIEWAFKKYGQEDIGRKIDQYIRRGNENRTHGIAVGPVISDVLAEIVLCDLDRTVQETLPDFQYNAYRFKDNYYFLCKNEAGAKTILHKLSIALRESHLMLNNEKTNVIDFNKYIANSWQIKFETLIRAHGLTKHPNPDESKISFQALHSFIQESLKLSRQYGNQKNVINKSENYLLVYRPYNPKDNIKYFYSIASMLQTKSNSFPLIFNLLMQLVDEDPNLLSELNKLATTLLKNYKDSGDDFSLIWLVYMLSDSKDIELRKVMHDATIGSPGLVGVAHDYLLFIESGIRPHDDPLWRHGDPDSQENNSRIKFNQNDKLSTLELRDFLSIKFSES